MKEGKVPEAVLKRSVLRNISNVGRTDGLRQRIGSDASQIIVPSDVLLAAAAVRQGSEPFLAVCAVHAAANNIFAKLGSLAGITAVLTLPQQSEEAGLKRWMRAIDKTCQELSAPLIAGHTSVSSGVTEPHFAITAFGSRKPVKEEEEKTEYSGFFILMTDFAGLEGTSRLAKQYEEELKQRLPFDFVKRAADFYSFLSLRKQAELLAGLELEINPPHLLCHDCSEGGIFGALWELSEFAGCGMDILLKEIALKQETIEICEYLDKNPYQLLSGGCLLAATDQPERILKLLHNAKIPCRIIGQFHSSKDCCVINGDESRFLEPFRQDEFYRI